MSQLTTSDLKNEAKFLKKKKMSFVYSLLYHFGLVAREGLLLLLLLLSRFSRVRLCATP